jgi:hypothetical protein
MLSTLMLFTLNSLPLIELRLLTAEEPIELRLDIVLSVLIVLALLTVDSIVSTVVSESP